VPSPTAKSSKSACTESFCFNDDGDLVAMPFDDWEFVFAEQRAPGLLNIWANPFTSLGLPKMYNLRMDPYEHADISCSRCDQWRTENVYLGTKAVAKSAAFLQTFAEYPPSQRPASFGIDQIRSRVDKKIDESFKQRGIE
jgi:arylsulfatase